MKRCYIYLLGIVILTAFLMGCEERLLDSDRELMASDRFVIDYTASTTGTTKSMHDNLSANRRISSLTYLLYDGMDGTLLKRREIPDLGYDTTWPLTRENMTWAQREALKDTLFQDYAYQVVFIANIDSSKSVLAWKEDGMLRSPLRNAENYQDAYLCYPSDQAFNDSTMFYWFSKRIESVNADRETPYDCPVILQRVVTRTDFLMAHLPDWENMEAEVEIPDTVKNYIDPYVHLLYSKAIAGEKPFIRDSVEQKMKILLDSIVDYFTKQIIPVPDEGELTEDQKTKNEKYNKWKTAIGELKTNLVNDSVTSFLMQEAPSMSLFGVLREDGLRNPDLRELWRSSWRKGKEAEVVFQKESMQEAEGTGTGVARISLSQTTAIGVEVSPHIPVDSSTILTRNGIRNQYDLFTWIGFGDPARNIFDQLKFYNKGATESSGALVVGDLKTGQSGNEWYQLVYDPMTAIELSIDGTTGLVLAKDKEEETTINGDFQTVLPFSELKDNDNNKWSEEDITDLVSEMNEALKAIDNVSYGENLNDVTFQIIMKDLSGKGSLIFTGEWQIQKKQGK